MTLISLRTVLFDYIYIWLLAFSRRVILFLYSFLLSIPLTSVEDERTKLFFYTLLQPRSSTWNFVSDCMLLSDHSPDGLCFPHAFYGRRTNQITGCLFSSTAWFWLIISWQFDCLGLLGFITFCSFQSEVQCCMLLKLSTGRLKSSAYFNSAYLAYQTVN